MVIGEFGGYLPWRKCTTAYMYHFWRFLTTYIEIVNKGIIRIKGVKISGKLEMNIQ